MTPLDAQTVARLAAQGQAACQGTCGRVIPVREAVNLRLGDQIVFAMCRRCFGEHDLVVHRTPAGLRVTAENRAAIVVAASIPSTLARSAVR